jgi:hypothetical protein
MNIYYVYAYLRSKDSATAKAGTPYYIGKGVRNRGQLQHRNIKSKKGVWTPSEKSRIVICESGLTELGAFALERRLIRWYGRKDLNTGILCNRTNGGDGATGVIISERQKDRIREGNARRKERGEYGHSEQARRNISQAQIGKKRGPMSEQQAKAISLARKGKPLSESHKQSLRGLNRKRRGPQTQATKDKIKATKLRRKLDLLAQIAAPAQPGPGL